MCDRKSAGHMLWAILLMLTVATGITACLNSSSTDPAPDPEALTITTGSPLPIGFVGTPYSLQLALSGGKPAFTWSLVTGSPALPTGLNLSPAGLISGTPTNTSAATPNFRVQDSSLPAPLVAAKELAITIVQVPQPTIATPSPLPNGLVNQAYPSTTLTATGGTPPYTFAQIVNGSFPALPSGLTFDAATATISGTPAPGTAGTTNHQFSVTDSFSPPQSSTKNFALTISEGPLPLTITTASLPPGTVAVPYPTTTLTPSGGTPPYVWSIVAGGPTPAPGLSLSPSGVTAGQISGTPSTNLGSPFTRTYQVKDSGTPQQTSPPKQLTITIGLPAAPSITTTSSSLLPNGVFDQFYSRTLQASGGTPPFVWSLTGGPNWLRLNNETGVISGTPNESDTFNFNVQVTDDAGQSDPSPPSLSITIDPPLTITTDELLEGRRNRFYTDTLEASEGTKPYTWLTPENPDLPAGLTLDPATGVISGTPTATSDRRHDFTVQDSTGQTTTKELRLRIRSNNNDDDDD